MSIRIDANTMRSNVTVHYAKAVGDEYGSWFVSWLPGRDLSRNQAITAMTLAETVAEHELRSDDPMWRFVDNWAAELDLTGPDAVVRVSEQSGVVLDRFRAELEQAGVTLRKITAGAS